MTADLYTEVTFLVKFHTHMVFSVKQGIMMY